MRCAMKFLFLFLFYARSGCPRPCLLLSTLGPVLAVGVPKPSIRTTGQDACSQGEIGDLSVSRSP